MIGCSVYTAADADEMICFLGDVFARHDPPAVAVGLTPAEFEDIVRVLSPRKSAGNVTSIRLPGGFRISFTGMQVLKHDGTPHHGVGIHPTVPASRTVKGIATGHDELLEKAIEVVRQP